MLHKVEFFTSSMLGKAGMECQEYIDLLQRKYSFSSQGKSFHFQVTFSSRIKAMQCSTSWKLYGWVIAHGVNSSETSSISGAVHTQQPSWPKSEPSVHTAGIKDENMQVLT